jgi:hypothetical protein
VVGVVGTGGVAHWPIAFPLGFGDCAVETVRFGNFRLGNVGEAEANDLGDAHGEALETSGVRGVEGAERLEAYLHAGVAMVAPASVLRLGAGKEEVDFCVGVGESVPIRFAHRLVTCEDCCDCSVAVVLTLLDTDGASDSSSSSSSSSSLLGHEDEVEVVIAVL